MKHRKMELILCEEFATGATNVRPQQLCIAAANSAAKTLVVVPPLQEKPKLTSEEEELLSFLSSDGFSFDSMQARWR